MYIMYKISLAKTLICIPGCRLDVSGSRIEHMLFQQFNGAVQVP